MFLFLFHCSSRPVGLSALICENAFAHDGKNPDFWSIERYEYIGLWPMARVYLCRVVCLLITSATCSNGNGTGVPQPQYAAYTTYITVVRENKNLWMKKVWNKKAIIRRRRCLFSIQGRPNNWTSLGNSFEYYRAYTDGFLPSRCDTRFIIIIQNLFRSLLYSLKWSP